MEKQSSYVVQGVSTHFRHLRAVVITRADRRKETFCAAANLIGPACSPDTRNNSNRTGFCYAKLSEMRLRTFRYVRSSSLNIACPNRRRRLIVGFGHDQTSCE